MNKASTPREFTGRHMLFLMLAFFGIIIGVNVTMAVLASASWTGFVVRNSYVASQQFNERAAEGRAQTALGWEGELKVADGAISYRMRDAGGGTVRLEGVTINLHRPVTADEDMLLKLDPVGDGAFAARHGPGDGTWVVRIEAEAGLDHPYRDVRRVTIRDGALR
ncbi:FixH family protein [Chelativorans xinjiangense]|uniref:FixH family protein n=1 Tax=Chelativorans xinjiangense TaxID=2681485 RepID=UPI00135B8A3E|nr:FixH family protein [Chelativorans xinjiangense]